mmetsp:Transcript_11823/g.25276  ORF Transcript_11823/g.25276 Transcript_11823/m.25276 type:complete len:300 (-) Transcript_11823:219-1118(-)
MLQQSLELVVRGRRPPPPAACASVRGRCPGVDPPHTDPVFLGDDGLQVVLHHHLVVLGHHVQLERCIHRPWLRRRNDTAPLGREHANNVHSRLSGGGECDGVGSLSEERLRCDGRGVGVVTEQTSPSVLLDRLSCALCPCDTEIGCCNDDIHVEFGSDGESTARGEACVAGARGVVDVPNLDGTVMIGRGGEGDGSAVSGARLGAILKRQVAFRLIEGYVWAKQADIVPRANLIDGFLPRHACKDDARRVLDSVLSRLVFETHVHLHFRFCFGFRFCCLSLRFLDRLSFCLRLGLRFSL